MHEIIHSFLHAIEHTLPIIPFLYLTYLLMEFLERRASERMEKAIARSGKVGPLFGALLGVVPQCGFSAVGSGLYAGRVISVGTLIAIFLSTSDEMLPLLVSSGAPVLLMIKILAVKVAVAMIGGFAVDAICTALRKSRPCQNDRESIGELCKAGKCNCENSNIFVAALIHTLKIGASVFVISFVLTLLLEFLGENALASVLNGIPVIGCLLAAFVGLIPNCASSVAITQLYLGGVISAGSMFSGLLVGAGMGIFILLRANRPIKDSLRIIAILFAIGLSFGVLFDLLSLGALLGI